jgi:large subunit ribosomal protein L21
MTYAVIAVGGRQYRVKEGQWLLVDRLPHAEGATFSPDVLLVGGNGDPKLGDDAKGVQVKAVVTAHVLGEKVVVGKHRQRTGYRRRNGHRSRLSRIEIQSIAAGAARRAPAKTVEPTEKPAAKAAAKPKPAPKPRAAAKPKPAAKPRAAAAKPKAPAKRQTKPKTEGTS